MRWTHTPILHLFRMAPIELQWDAVAQVDIGATDGASLVADGWRSLDFSLYNRDAFVHDLSAAGFVWHTNPNFRGRAIAVRPGHEPYWRI